MALKIITCPECEEQIQIDDQAKRNRCAVCDSVIVRNRAPTLPEKAKKPLPTPVAATEVILCPNCKQKIRINPSAHKNTCPLCKCTIVRKSR